VKKTSGRGMAVEWREPSKDHSAVKGKSVLEAREYFKKENHAEKKKGNRGSGKDWSKERRVSK